MLLIERFEFVFPQMTSLNEVKVIPKMADKTENRQAGKIIMTVHHHDLTLKQMVFTHFARASFIVVPFDFKKINKTAINI